MNQHYAPKETPVRNQPVIAACIAALALTFGVILCVLCWPGDRDNAVAQTPCAMDVQVIGYGPICADGVTQSPSPSTHVCFTVADEVVCVPLDRTVVRRSL